MMSCVTFIFFVSSPRHVAGLNTGRARNIAEWREQNGPFINREQLKLVKGMGPKTYQQCAGFIRINPQTRYTLCKLHVKIHKHTDTHTTKILFYIVFLLNSH